MTLRERLRRRRKPALSDEEREERLQAMARLAAAVREEIRRRFPEVAMEFPQTTTLVPAPWKGDLGEELVVCIPCPSGAIGDLTIVTDDTEATLYYEDMAVHEHFTAYMPVDPKVYEAASKAERDEFVATSCSDFLETLFDDKYVVWSAPDGRSGGLYLPSAWHRPTEPGTRAGTWSAPYSGLEHGGAETWAAADFERATTLVKQAMAAEEPIDRTWTSHALTWQIRRWQDRVSTDDSDAQPVSRQWKASLTAGSLTAVWSFSWTGDGWVIVDRAIRRS
jgi:hypothetical protein